MGCQQTAWEFVALVLAGKDLCVLASASRQLRAVSEDTVQKNLEQWPAWHPGPYQVDFSRWHLICLVEPGQVRRSSALDLPEDALWRKYWTAALEWWAHVC